MLSQQTFFKKWQIESWPLKQKTFSAKRLIFHKVAALPKWCVFIKWVSEIGGTNILDVELERCSVRGKYCATGGVQQAAWLKRVCVFAANSREGIYKGEISTSMQIISHGHDLAWQRETTWNLFCHLKIFIWVVRQSDQVWPGKPSCLIMEHCTYFHCRTSVVTFPLSPAHHRTSVDALSTPYFGLSFL